MFVLIEKDTSNHQKQEQVSAMNEIELNYTFPGVTIPVRK